MSGGARPRVLHYAHQHGSGHVRHAANLVRAGVADVIVKPHLSREKIDVFQAKEKLTGLPQNELAQLAQGPGVSVEFTDRLETVTFARR